MAQILGLGFSVYLIDVEFDISSILRPKYDRFDIELQSIDVTWIVVTSPSPRAAVDRPRAAAGDRGAGHAVLAEGRRVQLRHHLGGDRDQGGALRAGAPAAVRAR